MYKFFSKINTFIWTCLYLFGTLLFLPGAIYFFFFQRDYPPGIIALIAGITCLVGLRKKGWKKGLDWLS